MKYILIILGLFSINLKAQTILNFNKRFVECEDQWVAFQMNKDSVYNYGFIYIDAQAGLTLNYEGSFKITPDNIFVPKKKNDSVSFKYRLSPNQVKVAIIPSSKYKELSIKRYPDWLKIYESDTTSVARLYRWGYLYNSWDECAKALTYLEKGQKINPKYPGLEFELAFAYNGLGQFDKAIAVLEDAIKTNPNNGYMYKELSFAQIGLRQIEKAVLTCKKAIALCPDKSIKSEIAFNMAGYYFRLKDKENFKYWADETKKWATTGDRFMVNINNLEAKIEQ
ncbi:MAG: tetratricopeptide repeat protein [Bacteroidota bacterium]|nr:tetratricopeptide repeat protein [Bacteroidota bacterium]